jgi:DNA-damage-inducible protein D
VGIGGNGDFVKLKDYMEINNFNQRNEDGRTTKHGSIILFHEKQVRRHWDAEAELWYFSIIDIIEVLTDSTIPKRYWSDLKNKLKDEGSEVYDKIVRLKLIAPDGKNRETDCFSTQDLLRVIQSIPSPKAEPLKLWLAQVGYERIEETEDPELAFNRAKGSLICATCV